MSPPIDHVVTPHGGKLFDLVVDRDRS